MKERVFIIDTNVFIAGLLSFNHESPTVRILNAMLTGSILYVLSSELLEEYQTVLLRPKLVKLHKLTESEIEQLLSVIVANAVWREPTSVQHAPDNGDNHLWSLLLQTKDTVLVTGDQLLVKQPPTSHPVITPAIYFELYQSLGKLS